MKRKKENTWERNKEKKEMVDKNEEKVNER